MKQRKKLYAYPRTFAVTQAGVILREGGVIRTSQEAARRGVPYAWALRELLLSQPA